jgi:uracil-DNA glycosylase
VVNLKKIAGGSTAQPKEIREYAEKYWDLLEKQFKLYRPKLTIAGGVFDTLVALRGSSVVPQEGLRFPYFEDQDLGLCISFYHPQPRFRQRNQSLFDYLKQQLNYHQRLNHRN